jgi:hypothetical protein
MTSRFSDALAELRRQFAVGLSARIAFVHAQVRDLAAWQPAEAEVLHCLLQRITTSAGIFGMRSVSVAAGALEARLATLFKSRSVPTEADWRAIGADLDRMELLARVPPQASAPGQPLHPERSPQAPAGQRRRCKY